MVTGKKIEPDKEDEQECSDEETDGIAQETVDDCLFEAPSEEPIPYSLDEEDCHFTDEDVAKIIANVVEVEAQRQVGQHIDANGGEQYRHSPFFQHPQHPILDEDGKDEGTEDEHNRLRFDGEPIPRYQCCCQ